MTTGRTKRIAELNDLFRTTFIGGKVMCTPLVEASPDKEKILTAVREFRFRGVDGNNPWGENDFLTVEVGGEKYFAKIDYYDREMKFHSPDETDPSVTWRVLTVMHESEY